MAGNMNIGRTVWTGIALCLTVGPSAAAAKEIPALLLEPFTGDLLINAEKSQNFSGMCGTSVVRVLGVTSITGSFFGIDQDGGRVIVRQRHAPEVNITAANGLSDHNGVACVQIGGKTNVLIWAACGGSACGDDYSFTVVDADRPRITSPRDCDEVCARRLTGSDLPLQLNSKN